VAKVDNSGCTALHHAAATGRIECCRLLVRKIDPSIKNKKNGIPLLLPFRPSTISFYLFIFHRACDRFGAEYWRLGSDCIARIARQVPRQKEKEKEKEKTVSMNDSGTSDRVGSGSPAKFSGIKIFGRTKSARQMQRGIEVDDMTSLHFSFYRMI